jgi:hypothetical protein
LRRPYFLPAFSVLPGAFLPVFYGAPEESFDFSGNFLFIFGHLREKRIFRPQKANLCAVERFDKRIFSLRQIDNPSSTA